MNDYVLVLDTETSGLPKNWQASYDSKNNWPHILQFAWNVFDLQGRLIKKENHYIKPGAFKIAKSSLRVHQLNTDYLKHRGKDISSVMKRFDADLAKYSPLLVAHFYELDFHVLSAAYHRLGMQNNLEKYHAYCTMKASANYVKNPSFRYLTLQRFYKTLFGIRPLQLHNAQVDVKLTGEIFFLLLQNKEVSEDVIAQQQNNFQPNLLQEQNNTTRLAFIAAIIVIILITLIWFVK